MSQFVANGSLDVLEATGLTQDEAARIEAVWRALPEEEEEKAALKLLFEALGGRYDYGILRCLRASWGVSTP